MWRSFPFTVLEPSYCWDKVAEGRKVYFGSQSVETVCYDSRDAIGWLHGQEAESNEYLWLACFLLFIEPRILARGMVLPTVNVGLLTLINLI